jgi:hypothetical protein
MQMGTSVQNASGNVRARIWRPDGLDRSTASGIDHVPASRPTSVPFSGPDAPGTAPTGNASAGARSDRHHRGHAVLC